MRCFQCHAPITPATNSWAYGAEGWGARCCSDECRDLAASDKKAVEESLEPLEEATANKEKEGPECVWCGKVSPNMPWIRRGKESFCRPKCLFLWESAKANDESKRQLHNPTCPDPASPLSQQVGGDHYLGMAIQPFEYITRNALGFGEGCVIKYVSRWRNKNGVEDLRKAKQVLELMIAEEES